MKKSLKSKSKPKTPSKEVKLSYPVAVVRGGPVANMSPSLNQPKPEGTLASDIVLKPKRASLTDSLPAFLKDPANYQEIQNNIAKTMMGNCSHTEIHEMASCRKCTEKMLERRRYLKKLGFKNPAQYFAWQKIHQRIIETYPLVDFKTGKANIHKAL